MKKILLLCCLVFSCTALSQEDAWIYFYDKPQASYYLENPQEMLSPRALERRTNQGIALDETDVPIHLEYINAVAASEGIEIKAQSKWMNCVHVRGTIEAIQSMLELPFVERVHFANTALNLQNRQVSNQKRWQKVQKVWENFSPLNYGNSSNQVQMLNTHLLHQQGYRGEGKMIAVMDSGFTGVNTIPAFQRLRETNKILGGYNFVDRSDEFYLRHSHGTMVLSTMGGYLEGQLIGTAPDASYYLFITEDVNSENPVEESYWVEAAEKADSLGVDIINTSLGYFDYDNPSYSYTYLDMNGGTSFIAKGSDMAHRKGILCVASAGNSGNSGVPTIATPADAQSTLTVGAVRSNEIYAAFSSIGPSADGRIKPDVMAQGQASMVSLSNGTIGTASGTSFSAPIISGSIASFWQAIPWATNQQIIDFVKQSADRFSNPDFFFGYGIPDFSAAFNSANLALSNSEKQRFLIFPNPVKHTLYFSFPTMANNVRVRVYSTLGQEILSTQLSEQFPSVNLEKLPAGVYYYQLYAGTIIQNGQFIKS